MKNDSRTHLKFAVLAADAVVFAVRDNQLLVRLMHVERPPYFPNHWGFPGGLIKPNETALETTRRMIADRARVAPEKAYIEQLYTFDAIDRDPRGRVVAVAYLALISWDALSEAEQADSTDARWVPVASARSLAYDHGDILRVALQHLRSRVATTTVIKKLLKQAFTLSELEKAYTCILGTNLDKRNFRKKIQKLHILKQLKEKKTGGAFRPAQLYTFTSHAIDELSMV